MYDIQYADSKILLHCLLAAYIREVPNKVDGREKVIKDLKSAHSQLVLEDIGCTICLHYKCVDDFANTIKDSTIVVIKLGKDEYIIICFHDDIDVSIFGEHIAKQILEDGG